MAQNTYQPLSTFQLPPGQMASGQSGAGSTYTPSGAFNNIKGFLGNTFGGTNSGPQGAPGAPVPVVGQSNGVKAAGPAYNGPNYNLSPSFQSSTQTTNQSGGTPTGQNASIGSYKGIAINPGSDADIQAQIAKIDAQNTGTPPVGSTANATFSSDPQSNSQQNYNQMTNTGSAPQGTPVPPAPTQGSPAPAPTNAGVLNQIMNNASQYKTEQNQTAQQIADLRNNLQTDTGLIQSQPQELNFQTGRINALQTQEAAKEANLQGQLQSEIAAGQGANQAYSTAGGLLNQFTQAPYGTPLLQNATGNIVNTGANAGVGGSSIGPQGDLQNLSQAVANGTMTYPAAMAQLSNAYGGAIANQLLPAVKGIQPDFNVNQSNVNAQTQGSIGPQAALASSMIQNLQTTLANVPELQQTSFPLLNSLTALATNFGLLGAGAQQSSQELTNSVNEARQAVSTALGTTYNTTPTDFGGLVKAWFPDNPTPAQIQAGISSFNAMMAARTAAFGNAGTTPLPNGTTNTTNTTAGTTAGTNAGLDF